MLFNLKKIDNERENCTVLFTIKETHSIFAFLYQYISFNLSFRKERHIEARRCLNISYVNSQLVDLSELLRAEVNVRLCLWWRHWRRRLGRVKSLIFASHEHLQPFLLNEAHHLLAVALHQGSCGGSGDTELKGQ